MPALIKIKRSETSGNPSVLGAGELAYSGLTDNGSNGGDRLYIGMGTEITGNAVNHVVIGGKFFTDQITAATATAAASTLVRRDSSGNAAFATLTGDLIGTATTAAAWKTPRTLSLTGDGTASLNSVDGSGNVSAALTLATVNSNTGTFGSTTAIPVVTVNAKGLITAVSTASITSSFNIAGDTGSTAVPGGSSLKIFGSSGVTTTADNALEKVTISIGQPVATTDNVTFNNITANGTLYSNDITSTNVTVSGNATITGDLIVQGTTFTVNSSNIAVSDKNIVLAKDATTASAADGGGITVLGPTTPATITYSSIDDRWNLNKNLTVSTVYASVVGNASSADKWSTSRTLSLTGDATASLNSVDGSGNVSAALTLATVNSNTGSFGNSTTVPTITVNGKGLITAVSQNSIPIATSSVKGLSSFDSTNFTVSSGAVSIATVDGGTY